MRAESTIISHGMPYPQNVAVAKEVEAICRQAGAVPATIAVINGFPKVGLHDADFELLGKAEQNKVEIRCSIVGDRSCLMCSFLPHTHNAQSTTYR